MKKSSILGMALVAMLGMGVASCSDSNNDTTNSQTQLTESDQMLSDALNQTLTATIAPTYKALADSCQTLLDQLTALRKAASTKSVQQADVDQACATFLGARANYERSEAFLLGAADQHSIDPHIDSWPLNKAKLQTSLSNSTLVNSLDQDENGSEVYGQLGQDLVGFHSIEFILFRDGKNRSAAELNSMDTYKEEISNPDGSASGQVADFTRFSGEYELIYARAVAADLRNSVYSLYCGWVKDADKKYTDVLDDAGITYLMDNDLTYGENLINAGKPGSGYQTVKSAVAALLTGNKGCVGISDEVGNAKLANPLGAGNADEADINYVESPYSKHTKYDFYDNLGSIKNVWMGGVDKGEAGQANGTRDDSKASFYAYFQKYDPATNETVLKAIADAQAKILAIPGAFVDYCKANYGKNTAEGQAAIDAVLNVSKVLQAAEQKIEENTK